MLNIKRVKAKEGGSCSTCSRKKANVWQIISENGLFSYRMCNTCMQQIRAMHFLYYGGEDE